jgi:acid stress-induced BolA-like protein IbaG/YrbA
MAFQGSLKELPLPDIIQLVSVSGKTGKFTLTRDADRGFIFLKGGQMVHAHVGDLIGEEAIYALSIWNSGEFQFTAGEEPDRQSITKSNTNLLMEAARRLDEWRVLSKKIPSVDLVPELLARENRHEQVTLNPHEWLLITRIDGHRSIAEIGHALNMSSFDVAKILYGMITGELVHLKKKSERNPDEENGELVDLAARIRRVAEEFIGESAHKTIERHFLHALDGIMNGDGNHALDAMVAEFERTASLLRGIGVTEQLRSRINEIRALAS